MWRRSFLAIASISATEADKEKTSASALVAEVDFEPPVSGIDFIAICALIIHQLAALSLAAQIDFRQGKVLMLMDMKLLVFLLIVGVAALAAGVILMLQY
jgi:hypothetical protein